LNVIPSIVPHVLNERMQIIIPVIRTVGQMALNNDFLPHIINSQNFLNNIGQCIYHKKRTVRKETAWLLSNITAGTVDNI
jgi:hypothetical protein